MPVAEALGLAVRMELHRGLATLASAQRHRGQQGRGDHPPQLHVAGAAFADGAAWWAGRFTTGRPGKPQRTSSVTTRGFLYLLGPSALSVAAAPLSTHTCAPPARALLT